MSTALAERDHVDAAIVERVLIHGDLRQLTPAQKVSYYKHVCESVGLNPLTRPFEYIVLNGKETFYAKRDATDQLRKVHNVSVQIVAREVVEDCYVVTARATMPTGRQDESIGAVPIGQLKGEARANAMMKGETKAKRRVTLSICGLGMLDETEIESIPSAAPARQENAREAVVPERLEDSGAPMIGFNEETGEVIEPPPGFYFVRNYRYNDPWHEAYLLSYDSQGGSLKVSTKFKDGAKLGEAEQHHIPVSGEIQMKRTPGEAYIKGVNLLAPAEKAF